MNAPLVTFGDSWPYGSELAANEQPYGAILSTLLESEHYTNCACPATSNEHMILQLDQYAKQHSSVEGHVAVFFITYPGRSLLLDYNGKQLEVRPDANAHKDSRQYLYFKHFHTPLQEQFKTHQTMLALQRMSAELKLNDYYIVGWVPSINFDFPGIDKNKIYDQGQTTCADMLNMPGDFELEIRNSPYVNKGCCHPNQAGHTIIAHKLYKWISNVQPKI